MSNSVLPDHVRHALRASSSRFAKRCAVAVLLVAFLLVSLAINTQRAREHVIISAKYFQGGVSANALTLQPGAAGPKGTKTPALTPRRPPHAEARPRADSTKAAAAGAARSQLLQGRLNESYSGAFAHPAYDAAASIPRIIHQNYMSGSQQLLSDALKPLSHFRKEWWLSCKTHHPSWVHILWDEPQCEVLLRSRYSWFMETWHALGNNTVLKSDAIRPFILHAYGGVYLDLDSECFADTSPWLAGAQLVLQAEVGHTINNAQMASVPGHSLWSLFQRGIVSRVAAGKIWPLETTGPHLLTDVVRKLLNNSKGDLPGGYTLPDGSKLAVYGPQQWFTPCAWNHWTCAVKVARDRPLMKSAASTAVAAADAKALSSAQAARHKQHDANKSSPTGATLSLGSPTTQTAVAAAAAAVSAVKGSLASIVPQGFPVMLGAAGVCGVHHFSGSWLGLDGSKSLTLRKEGVTGVLNFLYGGSGFVQQPCRDLRLLPSPGVPWPTSTITHGGATHITPDVTPPMLSFPVCWESINAALKAGNCKVLSIRPRPAWCLRRSMSSSSSKHNNCGDDLGLTPDKPQQQGDLLRMQAWLAAELALAGAGCPVKLVTDTGVDLERLTSQLGVLASQQKHTRSTRSTGPAVYISQTGTGTGSSGVHETAAVLSRLSLVTAVLGVTADPFAEPPVQTLDTLMDKEQGGSRTTLLLMDLADPQPPCRPPGTSCTAAPAPADALDVLNQLYLTSSTALQHVDALMLSLPATHNGGGASSAAHKAYAAYQHLFQEIGFTGYYHSDAGRLQHDPGALQNARGRARGAGSVHAPDGGQVVLQGKVVLGLSHHVSRLLA